MTGRTATLGPTSPTHECGCGARYYGARAASACCAGRDVTEVDE